MNFVACTICIAAFATLALAGATHADVRIFNYQVEHPRYGDIGTYVYSVDRVNGEVRIETQLRVAVKVIGFVIYRQNANQVEVFREGALTSFQSVTETNNHRVIASGIAKEGRFYVTSPTGISVVPANVLPSDPWSLKHIGSGVVVSTKSGKIENVEATGGEVEKVLVNGMPISTRHFHVNTETQNNKWEVWLDQNGSPVKFRSLEDGTPISFTLTSVDAHASSLFGLASGSDQRHE